MERGLRADALLDRSVISRDIHLGTVADVILDPGVTRALGLEVRCGDGVYRFLPLAALELNFDRIRVDSALVLVAEALDHYGRDGRRLTALADRSTPSLAADGSVIPGDSPRAAV